MLKKLYFFLAFFLFVFASFLGIDRIAHRTITHFSPHKIRTSNLFLPSQTPVLSLETREWLEEILNQKFIFYHKAKTSYSFISEDGHYILKFMTTQRVKPKSWLAYIPCSFNLYYQEFIAKKQEANKVLKGWQFAFEHLQQETALVYAHTSRKERLRKKVVVLDKDLEPYTIDLDKTVFCIQKHADLFYVHLAQLLRERDMEPIKEKIASVFSLISHLCCEGVLNSESVKTLDVGIVNNQVVQVDIDKLCTSSLCVCKKNCKETVSTMTQKFRTWVEEHCSELGPYFDELIEKTSSDLCKSASFETLSA